MRDHIGTYQKNEAMFLQMAEHVIEQEKAVGVYQIFVLKPPGNRLVLDVTAEDTVLSIKRQIEKAEEIPIDQQRLIFQGKQLDDDRTLES